MRALFPGYYKPTEQEFGTMWQECIFAFDANVLLNVYRYTPTTQARLIDILQKLGDRIWVPYQVAFEYQERRLDVISQQIKAYDEIIKVLQDSFQSIVIGLRIFQRHPFLDIDTIIKKVSETFETTKQDLQKLQLEHPNLVDHDPLWETITNLFEGKVGQPYTKQRREEIHKLAEQRFKDNIPPGYKDKGKEGQKQSGDVVVWFQVIDHAKAQKKPIIFVTDDRKEDWWFKHRGKTIGPRPELIQEMASEADVAFYMYQTDQFMDYAEKFLHLQEQPAAIAEVREIREQDEARQFLEDTLQESRVQQSERLATQTATINPPRINNIQQPVDLSSFTALARGINLPSTADMLREAGVFSSFADLARGINLPSTADMLREAGVFSSFADLARGINLPSTADMLREAGVFSSFADLARGINLPSVTSTSNLSEITTIEPASNNSPKAILEESPEVQAPRIPDTTDSPSPKKRRQKRSKDSSET